MSKVRRIQCYIITEKAFRVKKMNTKVLLVLLFAFCFYSCKEKKTQVPVFESSEETMYDSDSSENEEMDTDESDLSEIAVPFKVNHGVKTVEVKINDAIGVDMIVDTGCSGTLISLSEAKYLAEKGELSQDDVLGTSQSLIADGTITVNSVIRLRKLTIANKLSATYVTATVSDNIAAPLLLGNEVFDRVKEFTIDNDNQQIIFHLR